jgi:hypothetical protein
VHLLATAYGWTKRDVLDLSYQEIEAFLRHIAEDRRREAEYAKRRTSSRMARRK